MIRDKRGLSEVIVTLITVLLAIVAIGIIWVVIANIIGDTSEDVQKNIGMVVLDIKNNEISEVEGKAILTVRRLSGPGDMTGIKVFFETESGNLIESEKALVIGEQQTTKVELDFTPTTEYIKSVTIYPQNTFEGETYSGQTGTSAEKKSPENLVKNPGFEEWVEECSPIATIPCPEFYHMYVLSGTRNVYREETNVKSGKYSAEITNSVNAALGQRLYFSENLKNDTKYISTSWIMCPASNSPRVAEIMAQPQPASSNLGGNDIPCDGEWHYSIVEWTSSTKVPVTNEDDNVMYGHFTTSSVITNNFYVDDAVTYEAIA